VAEAFPDGLRVNALRDEQADARVAQIVEAVTVLARRQRTLDRRLEVPAVPAAPNKRASLPTRSLPRVGEGVDVLRVGIVSRLDVKSRSHGRAVRCLTWS
jgi:hypothetical protein